MMDYRLSTYLTLCRTRSYTKTAALLHITQPAVTQHIQHLEAEYGCKLLTYSGRTLTLTEKGKLLYRRGLTFQADAQKLKSQLACTKVDAQPLIFGATLTIAEYTMPRILGTLLQEHRCQQVRMEVGNTQTLLRRLEEGAVHFVLLEGHFDKSLYAWRLLRTEPFIGVCAASSPLAGRALGWNDLFCENLILRERGSGSRDIFERILHEHNYSIQSFCETWELGNINAIKQLVEQGLGITFLYQIAATDELKTGMLQALELRDFAQSRDFHFVFLQNSQHAQEYERWYEALYGLVNATSGSR